MLNNNNNNHNSSCMFAEEIVSYLYNETSPKKKFAFETHLKNCVMCADELAGFGFVRSSLTEWRNEEVFALEMPGLENPAINTSVSIVSTVSGSWFDRLRELFTWFPALRPASVALAVLIVFAAFAIFFFNSSNNNEVASNSEKNPAKDSVESVNKEEAYSPSQIPPQMPENGNVSDKKSEPAGTVVSKDSSIKTSNDSPKPKNIAPKVNETVAGNVKNKEEKKSNVQKREVPTLAPYDEVEDKSLRLADLFEEIDTK